MRDSLIVLFVILGLVAAMGWVYSDIKNKPEIVEVPPQ